jgi:hypothetical protein
MKIKFFDLEKEYRQTDAINYSFLKELSISGKRAKRFLDKIEEDVEKEYFTIGKLVEDYLFKSKEEFLSKLHVMKCSMPEDKMLLVANKVVEIKTADTEDKFDMEECILHARKEIGYDSRLKDETFLTRFHSEAAPYVDEKLQNLDKTCITLDMLDLIETLVQKIRTSPYFKDIFNDDDNIEVLLSVPIYFSAPAYDINMEDVPEGAKIKVLVDILVINHTEKTIRGVDLKTYELSFLKNFYTYKYYYQGSLYTIGIEEFRIGNIDKYSEYTILPFRFLAVDKSLENEPAYYTLSEEMFTTCLQGGVINNYYVTGIFDLVSEYYHRNKINNWDDHYEMIVEGEIIIKNN